VARLAEASLRPLDASPIESERLHRFYGVRQYVPVWFAPGNGPLKPAARVLLALLETAREDGLVAADYHVKAIAARLEAGDGPARAELELLLTDGLIGWLDDVRTGRVDPGQVNRELALVPTAIDAVALAQKALEAPDLAAFLAHQRPSSPLYQGLRVALERLRAQEQAGGWPTVPAPAVDKLAPGMRDAAVPALRQRLLATGELTAETPASAAAPSAPPSATAPTALPVADDPELYDEALARALQRFQANNGLLVDGVLGGRTRRALNRSVAERIQTVIANLERARWLPEALGERHLLVNVAGYTLQAFEGGKLALQMAVVVGTSERHTPMLGSRISTITLNPTWTVPVKLSRQDILPRLRRDPEYLKKQRMVLLSGWDKDAVEVDPATIDWNTVGDDIGRFRLRQEPGDGNSLGRVKFSFPNRFDVYLHGTPHQELFERSARSFSSGCVRLADPNALALWLLAGHGGWSAERLDQAIAEGGTRWVELPRAVPVYLFYATAWLGDDRVVQFREDIYDRDGQLLKALGQRHQRQTAGASP